MLQVIMRKPFYYGRVVVGVTALTILVAAGVRSAPGVFIYPLEVELGWSRQLLHLRRHLDGADE
ncbi:MAG: hypothetical protein HY331_02165 [Chloroflexi bacterium]|nr:hypothetical protein [Chloroflexota bacterium]